MYPFSNSYPMQEEEINRFFDLFLPLHAFNNFIIGHELFISALFVIMIKNKTIHACLLRHFRLFYYHY